MFLRTRVKNNTNVERNLRWAGIKGVSIAPEGTMELPDGYPSACRNEQCRKQFEHEMMSGLIGVTIVTDMDVLKEEPEVAKKDAVKTATVEIETDVGTPEVPVDGTGESGDTFQVGTDGKDVGKENVSDHLMKVDSPEKVRKDLEEPTFFKGPMDDFFKKAFPDSEKVSLTGNAGVPPEEMPSASKVPIFKDAVEPHKSNAFEGVTESIFVSSDVVPPKPEKASSEDGKPAPARKRSRRNKETD